MDTAVPLLAHSRSAVTRHRQATTQTVLASAVDANTTFTAKSVLVLLNGSTSLLNQAVSGFLGGELAPWVTIC